MTKTIGTPRSTPTVVAEIDTPTALTVPLKACCRAVLAGEDCPCDDMASGLAELAANAIRWNLRRPRP